MNSVDLTGLNTLDLHYTLYKQTKQTNLKNYRNSS